LLLGEDPDPARRQVTEIPPIKPEVVEYRQHRLTCLACGAENTPAWPAELSLGSFGPRLHATVAYLTGQVHVSQREVEGMLATLFHTDVALGSIPTLEQRMRDALAEPVAEAEAYVHQQAVNNVDETSWPEGPQRAWLWINTTPLVTLFLILTTRGTASAKRVLGETYPGVVGSDRWSAYNWLDPTRRQVCWSHLIRDFQAFVDREGEPARIGTALLEQVAQMFALWYRVRDGTLSRADFQVAMQPIQTRVGELLREGTTLSHDKTRRTCERILKIEPALWTFVRVEGVEPTNNDAERPLRRPVLWRRRSFGTQSAAGSRFVERVLTTVTTLRQQERDVLEYLTAACIAAARGESPPSLLPDAACATAVA
jgi:transposase